MFNFMSKSYFHYRDYLINGKKANYNYQLDDAWFLAYRQLHDELEYRERQFYIAKFSNKRYNIEPPENWKEELENYLSTGGLTPKRANEIAAVSFADSNTVDEFREILINNIREELNVKEDFNKTIEKIIQGAYESLLTRYHNETIELKHRKKTGQLYISGSYVKTLEGWMIEIAQGVVSPEKQSTSEDKTLKFIADYQVPDVGLEEVKRGITTGDTGQKILDSQFHIGSFTANLSRKIPGYLRDALANCVTEIVKGIITLESNKIEDARRIFFTELSSLIYPYFQNRLLGYTKRGEIFYFSSGPRIILGSDFISAIAGWNKLYIDGSTGGAKANFKPSIGIDVLKKIGVSPASGSFEDLGLNLDSKGEKLLMNELDKHYKNGAFLTYAKFDLWYGKRY